MRRRAPSETSDALRSACTYSSPPYKNLVCVTNPAPDNVVPSVKSISAFLASSEGKSIYIVAYAVRLRVHDAADYCAVGKELRIQTRGDGGDIKFARISHLSSSSDTEMSSIDTDVVIFLVTRRHDDDDNVIYGVDDDGDMYM